MTFVDDDGNEIEVSGDIAITKQAVSFFNSKIKGDVSTTFQIDNNSKNRKTLGYYGPQMLNQIAYTKQAFNRVRNGNILDRGFIVIQSDKGSTLSCFYVSGNSNWFQLLEGLITELDFTGVFSQRDYRTQMINSSITNSVGATSGIIFPLVDWNYNLKKGNLKYFGGGNGFATKTSILDQSLDYWGKELFDFYPCFYLHTLIDELCSQSGIKIEGNLLDDAIYKSLIIPPVNGKLNKISEGKLLQVFGSSQTLIANEQYTSFNNKTFDTNNYFSSNTFTAKNKTVVRFEVTLVSTSRTAPDVVFIRVTKNYSLSTTQEFVGYSGKAYVYFDCVPGDIFQFFGPDLAGDYTFNLTVYENETVTSLDYVNPYMFLPDMSGITLLKNIFNMFGCVVTFDEYSKTITANMIEKINLEESYDWSDYFISAEYDYTLDQGKNNYLRYSKTDDTYIKKYNNTNLVKYGDGNIQTPNTLKENNNIFTSAFTPSYFQQSINNIFLANVPLVNLIDQDPLPFTSVSAGFSGFSTFAFAEPHNIPLISYFQIVRITNGNTNLGYFVATPVSLTEMSVFMDFQASFTGNFYRQEAEYKEVGPKLLTVKNNTLISDISPSSEIELFVTSTPSDTTNLPYAVFTKQFTGEPIDGWRNNLAFDNPDIDGYNDPTLKELYFNKISRFLQNPNIECEMLLPEAVFQRFKFDRFIYLNTEGLRGYFFVESIENYIDGTTPVTVNLYMI